MIQIIDPEAEGIPVLNLTDGLWGAHDTASAHPGSNPPEPACHRCAAYRPAPQLSGNLQVDPEIHLPSIGMDVEVGAFYNAASAANGPFGYGRTLSPNLTAQASGSPALVTLVRGNGGIVSYQDNGSSTFLPQTPGLLNTLVKDSVNGLWKETTPDGRTLAFPLDTLGHVTTLSWVQDAIGNTHSLTYSGGLLQSLEDAAGRLVTFGYSGGLLQTIQDWAGRVTTFAYNTTVASPKNLLTTVTGPTGCQTQYQYTTFALSGGSSDWLLSGIVDPNGYGTSYTYDQQKRVVTRVGAGVGTTTHLYQPGVMLTVDGLGQVTTQAMDANFNLSGQRGPTGAQTTFTRNAQGFETSRMDVLGNVTSTLYDGSNRVNGTINALGYRTTITHDSYNNITSVQTGDGAIWTSVWGYGSSGFDTTGAKRRLQASVDPLGNITSYGYTAQGLLSSETNLRVRVDRLEILSDLRGQALCMSANGIVGGYVESGGHTRAVSRFRICSSQRLRGSDRLDRQQGQSGMPLARQSTGTLVNTGWINLVCLRIESPWRHCWNVAKPRHKGLATGMSVARAGPDRPQPDDKAPQRVATGDRPRHLKRLLCSSEFCEDRVQIHWDQHLQLPTGETRGHLGDGAVA